jgi:hypothetical protein
MMSKIKDFIFAIQEEVEGGNLTFRQIAAKYGVEYEVVVMVAEELQEQYGQEAGF